MYGRKPEVPLEAAWHTAGESRGETPLPHPGGRWSPGGEGATDGDAGGGLWGGGVMSRTRSWGTGSGVQTLSLLRSKLAFDEGSHLSPMGFLSAPQLRVPRSQTRFCARPGSSSQRWVLSPPLPLSFRPKAPARWVLLFI